MLADSKGAMAYLEWRYWNNIYGLGAYQYRIKYDDTSMRHSALDTP